MTFRDATFGELPTSMDTESSNGKEGMVTLLNIVLIVFTLYVFLVWGWYMVSFLSKQAPFHFDRKQWVMALRLPMLWQDLEMRRVGGSWERWSCSVPCVWSGSLQTHSASTLRMYSQTFDTCRNNRSASSFHDGLCTSLTLQDLSSVYD